MGRGLFGLLGCRTSCDDMLAQQPNGERRVRVCYITSRTLTGFLFCRCVAAILSSNMDLSLWHTAKNTIKGEWAKVWNFTRFSTVTDVAQLCELTPFIAELASRESHSKAEQTLRSQITSKPVLAPNPPCSLIFRPVMVKSCGFRYHSRSLSRQFASRDGDSRWNFDALQVKTLIYHLNTPDPKKV
jgi:hypothetical protein